MPFVLLFSMAYRCNMPLQKTMRQNSIQPQISIKLPDPVYKSDISIEEALLKRRSVRGYKNEALELKEISQLLWAAQGITSKSDGGRTVPSAGALYPLEIYLATGNINSLPPGVYHYQPFGHTLQLITEGDKIKSLSVAAHSQGSINRSMAVIVIAAEYSRTTRKYSERGIRYVQLEAGHAAQNICLQAISLNLGTVTIGAFTDSMVKQTLNLPETEEPLYLMPVGKKRN